MNKIKISNEHFEKSLEARALLEKRYPNCFQPEGEEPKPLKINIIKDLKTQREQYSDMPANTALDNFLRIYTGSKEYIDCLQQPSAMRVDLDGNDVEIVSDTHKEFAKQCKPRKVKIKPDIELNDNKEKKPLLVIPSPKKEPKQNPSAKKPITPIIKLKRPILTLNKSSTEVK